MPGTQPSRLVLLCGLILLAACQPDSTPATPAPTIPLLPTLTLTANIVLPPSAATPNALPRARRIELNSSIEGVYVPNRGQELYTFILDQSHRIGILLEAADGGAPLNLVTRVYNEAGDLQLQITAPVGQPMLRNEWDLAPGGYGIEIFGEETSARAFTLSVIERPVAESGGGVIHYGETRSGEIRIRGQRDIWTFQGQAGDQVLVTMTAVNADAYLELYAPDGSLLAQDDDSAQFGRNPVLAVTLVNAGEYRLVARMVDDDQTGAYQIVLERAEH